MCTSLPFGDASNEVNNFSTVKESSENNESESVSKNKDIENFIDKLIEFLDSEPSDIDSTIFKIESIQNIFQSLHGDTGRTDYLKDLVETAKKLR